MARSKRRRNGRSKARFTLPVAIVAGFIPPLVGVWNRRNSGTAIGDYLKGAFIGLDSAGNFNPALLKSGLMPVVLGMIMHMVASRFGVNRALGRAGIPFIRV